MKLHIYSKPCDNGNLRIYTIKVNTLIGKRVICYIKADKISFSNFIYGGMDTIRSEYNYIEHFYKGDRYRYIRHCSHCCKLSIKFTKYMTFIVWVDRNITINKLKRFIKSPINVIKNTILKYKIKSKVQDFEEFYNK